MSNNNDIEKENKPNWFIRFCKFLLNGIKYCFSKCKAVFVFLAMGLISLVFISKVSKTAIKEEEKKNETKNKGEDVQNSVDDLKTVAEEQSDTIKEAKTVLNDSIEIKDKLQENENKTQEKMAEDLGFKKVE